MGKTYSLLHTIASDIVVIILKYQVNQVYLCILIDFSAGVELKLSLHNCVWILHNIFNYPTQRSSISGFVTLSVLLSSIPQPHNYWKQTYQEYSLKCLQILYFSAMSLSIMK